MDERTRAALEASIQHWRENLAAETPEEADTSYPSCALCGEFRRLSGCDGCPVKTHSGRDFCGGTPYREAYCALMNWRLTKSSIDRDDFRVWAKAEVELLESLR